VKRYQIAILLVLVPALIWFVGFTKLHFIRQAAGGGFIFWSSDQAYLVLSDCPHGFVMSATEFLGELTSKHRFGPVSIPATSKCVLTQLRVTAAGVSRHEVPEIPLRITPLDGAIYALCGAKVCKWNGNEFAFITEDENKSIGGLARLSGSDFSNENGWSLRRIRSPAPDQPVSPYTFSVNLDEAILLSVTVGNPVSVILQRPNGASEQIWYEKQRTRLVSRKTYNRVFAEPD
jgi:hypothetical protein